MLRYYQIYINTGCGWENQQQYNATISYCMPNAAHVVANTILIRGTEISFKALTVADLVAAISDEFDQLGRNAVVTSNGIRQGKNVQIDTLQTRGFSVQLSTGEVYSYHS